jgi:hypothetical protein
MLTSVVVITWLLAATGAPAPDDLVAFVADVEQARGHLLASRESYALARQHVRAGVHASHPVQELGRRLYAPVQAVDPALGARVRDALNAASRALAGKPSPATYDAAVREVETTLEHGVTRVVPARMRADAAFRAAVVRRLLLVIEEEYEEAVADGRVVLEIEYQDAYGFLRRAHVLWQGLRRDARLGAERRTTVDQAFRALSAAMPGIRPPAEPATPERVAGLLKSIDTVLAPLASDRR